MIIGVSGKIGTGKDTVGKAIQYLMDWRNSGYLDFNNFLECYNENHSNDNGTWKIKKFADKLKDIVCLLIGCTREQLEDQTFKNTSLGEEWTRYGYANGFIHKDKPGGVTMNYQSCDKERYELELKANWQTAYKSELTPRLLLQLLGTNCGRDIIHPNIWVNSVMADYQPIGNYEYPEWYIKEYPDKPSTEVVFPCWIITDVRFPNEAKAIKDRNGVLIRINRNTNSTSTHESETALDDYAEWDHVIDNNGTIEELVEKVKLILNIKEYDRI